MRPTTSAFKASMFLSIGLARIALGGASVIVPVAEDESVNGGFPDKNYAGNTNRGGLFVGCDGTGAGPARFYLKFNLPEFLDPAKVVSATLSAIHQDDLDSANNGMHRIHFVASDTWHEDTITWANQPGPTFGSPEASFDSGKLAIGETGRWDLTDLVRNEMKGDDTLSLMFAAGNESIDRTNRNWEYFAEHEFDPTRSFRLTLATSASVGGGTTGGPVAVPLPPAAWPAMATLLGAGLLAMKKRVRRAA